MSITKTARSLSVESSADEKRQEHLNRTVQIIDLVRQENGTFGIPANAIEPYKKVSAPRTRQKLNSLMLRIRKVRRSISEDTDTTFITAVIPAHKEESSIARTIESLLLQTRMIDRIVVMVNNSDDKTAKIARMYEREFPERIIVEDEQNIKHGKVGALGYAWQRYVANGKSDYALFVDADVDCDADMLKHLEKDLDDMPRAAGVRSKYSFALSDSMSWREKSLVRAQRHEFAQVEMRDQLRHRNTRILGGQATLFRASVLDEVAEVTRGNIPWDYASSVEDSKLSDEIRNLGYLALVSKKARANVGAMITPRSLRQQRIKWTHGHLTDAFAGGEFKRIGVHKHVWTQQISMLWNLLIRLLFATMLAVSLTLHMFVFVPLWLLPSAMSVAYNVLVACKIPNRTPMEIVRSALYFPDEIALWRTLSVWLTSWCLMIPFIAVTRDSWKEQQKAENSKKTGTMIAWLGVIVLLVVPYAALMALSGVIGDDGMSVIVKVGWLTASVMTIISTIVLLLGILRAFWAGSKIEL